MFINWGKMLFIVVAVEYALATLGYVYIGDWKHAGVAFGYAVAGGCFVLI